MSLSFAGVLQKGDGSLIELQSFYPPNVNEFIGSGQKRDFDCGSQGILLKGIEIWSGAAYKAQKSLFDNSFSNSFCFISTLQTILTMYGFHLL